MALTAAQAQTAPEVPRLVVQVVVDQLRTDYLEAFSPLYGENGFRKLQREGSVYHQAEYPFALPDRASAVAALMSGSTPYENGIVGQRWLDRQTLAPVSCIADKKQTGVNTREQVSPANLTVTMTEYATNSPFETMHIRAWGAALIITAAVLALNILCRTIFREKKS